MESRRKRIVVLFPGQGSIKEAKSIDFLDTSYARELDAKAKITLGESILEKILNSTHDDWSQTSFAQPAIFYLSLLSFFILKDKADIFVLAAAGHSLGELTALVASGFIDVKDGFKLAAKRGLLMEQCCRKTISGMLAVIGENPYLLQDLAAMHGVFLANLNSPTQAVFAGELERLKHFSKTARELGYRTVYLNVQGGFHSPMMAEAAEAFKDELHKYEVDSGSFPVISNVDALPYETESLKDKLAAQIVSQVRWKDVVNVLAGFQPDYWIEAFPGNVLLRMLPQEITGNRIAIKGIQDILDFGELI